MLSNKSFIVLLLVENDKKYDQVFKVCNKFGMEKTKNDCNLALKCHVLSLADVFQKFRNNYLKIFWIIPELIFARTSFKLECNDYYRKK